MIPNNELRSRGGQNRQFVDFSGYSSPTPNPSIFKSINESPLGSTNLPPPNLNPNLLPPPTNNLFQFQNNHKHDDNPNFQNQPPSFRSFVNPPNYPFQQQQQSQHHNPVKTFKPPQKSGFIRNILCCCDAPRFLCLFLWLVLFSILTAIIIMVVVYRNPQVAENVIQSDTYKTVEQKVKSYLDKRNQQQQTPPVPEQPATPPQQQPPQEEQQQQPKQPEPPATPPQVPQQQPPVPPVQQQPPHRPPVVPLQQKQPEVGQQDAQTLSTTEDQQKKQNKAHNIVKEIPQEKPPLKKKKQKQPQEYEQDEFGYENEEEYGYGDDEFEDELSSKKKKKNLPKTTAGKSKKPKKEFHVDFEDEFGTAEELEQIPTSADIKQEPEEEVVLGDYEEGYPTQDSNAGDAKKKKKVDTLQQHIHEEEAKNYQKQQKQKGATTASAAAENQDTVEFRRQNRKFLRKIAKLVSQSAKLNINVNENHQKALLYWLRAFIKLNHPEAQTLIHFSSVPSIELPKTLELDQEGIITESSFSGINATNYIMPLIYMGYVSKIVWVKPPWVGNDIKDGTYMFHIGHVDGTKEMGIDINTLKQFEPYYQKNDKLVNTKMGTLEIISLDKWLSANSEKDVTKSLEQLIGIPDINTNHLPPLLDLDLSFFVSSKHQSTFKTPIKGMEKLSEMTIKFLTDVYTLASIQYPNTKAKRPPLVVIGRSINNGLVPIDLWSDAEQYALHVLINVFQDLKQKKEKKTNVVPATPPPPPETKKTETKKTTPTKQEQPKQDKKKPKTQPKKEQVKSKKEKNTPKKQTKKPRKEKRTKQEKEPEGEELVKKMKNHAFFKSP